MLWSFKHLDVLTLVIEDFILSRWIVIKIPLFLIKYWYLLATRLGQELRARDYSQALGSSFRHCRNEFENSHSPMNLGWCASEEDTPASTPQSNICQIVRRLRAWGATLSYKAELISRQQDLDCWQISLRPRISAVH